MLMPAPRSPRCLAGSTELAELAAMIGLPPLMAMSLAELDLEATGNQILVLLHDPREAQVNLADLQARVRRAGVALLVIDWLADRARIGPLILPDEPGCVTCRDARIQNNLRRPQHTGGRIGGVARPGPMVQAVIRDLLSEFLANGRDERLVSGYVTVHFHSLRVETHHFTPVTDCVGCADQRQPDEAPPAALELVQQLKDAVEDKRIANPRLTTEALRKAFVDRECGVIKHVFQDSTSALMPMCVAEMQLPGEDTFESGYGRAESLEKSELVAILEAVERYAGHRPRAGQATLRGSYLDLLDRYGSAQIADPRSFILHGEMQYADPAFGLRRYDPELDCNWCWGYSLVRNQAVLVPEQLVYYRTGTSLQRPTNRFVFDSSNGCSLGGCIEEAILGGLYELVERDAYLTAWYAQHPLRRIANETVTDAKARALIARSQADGYDVYLFDMSADTAIPAVWGMIVDPSNDPVVKSYCASACHGRWDEAIFSALVEITTSMGVYRRSMQGQRENAQALLDDHARVREMPDHVLLFSHPDTYRELNFLHHGGTVSLETCRERLPDHSNVDLAAELNWHVGNVAKVSNDIIVVDQTFPGLQPLGLSCVKVLATGLLPVTFGHQYRRVDPARITNAARARGYAGPTFSETTVNQFPHNFP